ncbi:DUF2971 domain-containing protein [Ewingella americana]|uniref:DUF2971 domain-containing protein n=1 Tax=Ewingella americana TaxID=41202 RepID=A0A502G7J1_9GAMM|nr:DUF2971 domain-containing protein [Ewingella americana]TPG56793.1 DUF2971 domain-containing protein [Ewingella americana]
MSHGCARCNGRRFLKFVPEDRIDVVQNGLICMTPPVRLNDPFEVNPIVIELDPDNYNNPDVPTDLLTPEDHEYSYKRQNLKYEYMDKYRTFANNFGILSLVSGDDMSIMPGIEVVNPKDPRRNLLMWAHYANQHKGFVIEFSSDFMTSEGFPEQEIIEVNYHDERPFILFEDIDAKNTDAFYRKGASWMYEQEWRLVRPLSEAASVTEEGHHLFKFNRASIVSITAGCRMSDEKKEALKTLIRTDPELVHTKYLQARIGNEHNTVVFDDFIFDGKRELTNGPILKNGMGMIEFGFNQLCPSSMRKYLGKENEMPTDD